MPRGRAEATCAGPHDVALVAQRAFVGAHRRVPHAFAQCGLRPQQHAVIVGVLKMQMTEQAAARQRSPFGHRIHRHQHTERAACRRVRRMKHITGFALQPLGDGPVKPIPVAASERSGPASQSMMNPSASPAAVSTLALSCRGSPWRGAILRIRIGLTVSERAIAQPYDHIAHSMPPMLSASGIVQTAIAAQSNQRCESPLCRYAR